MKKKETIEYLKGRLDILREEKRFQSQDYAENELKITKLYETQIKVAEMEIRRLNIILNNYEVKLQITVKDGQSAE